MNRQVKFHKPNGPAFNKGERWIGSSKSEVVIISVEKFGEGKFDHQVKYSQVDGSVAEKDAWNFQVRYQHIADKNIKKHLL